MANIQPVVFPIIGTATKLEVLVLNFYTDAATANTYYSLKTEEGVVCTQGNYQMTEQEYETWGQDNSYVDQVVAAHLGLTIVP